MALRCQGLVKHYGDVKAVDGIDLHGRPGECLGLLGPNGAGKTTTVEILEGLTIPDAGQVEVLGLKWGTGHDRQIRERIGVQLQETRLSDKLTVRETLRLFRSFYASGRQPTDVIAMLGLQEKTDARLGHLSGGQKQRVALACALVGDPEILFLDEPTTGLDPQARLRIWEVVETFRQGGGTALLTTHYMDEAARLCDRVAVIDHGRVIALDTPAALIASLGGGQILEFTVDAQLETAMLEGLAGVTAAALQGDGSWQLTISEGTQALSGLIAALDSQSVQLEELVTHQATLEDVFIHLTGRNLRDG